MSTKQLYVEIYRTLRFLDRIYEVSYPGATLAMMKANKVCDRLDRLKALNPSVYHAAFVSYQNANTFVG